MIDYGCFTKDENIIEMDKEAGGTYIFIKDKDPGSVFCLKLWDFVKFLMTHPVTKKRITYEEYESFRGYDCLNFDRSEIFFYLAEGNRFLMEMEVEDWLSGEVRTAYYDPHVEECIFYHCPPSQYLNGFGPDGDLLDALFKKLNQVMMSEGNGNSHGYILTDTGIQETEDKVRFDMDGFRWECVAGR